MAKKNKRMAIPSAYYTEKAVDIILGGLYADMHRTEQTMEYLKEDIEKWYNWIPLSTKEIIDRYRSYPIVERMEDALYSEDCQCLECVRSGLDEGI